MQYWHFLMLPGLKFVSRYQLAFAILMFLGSPAWMRPAGPRHLRGRARRAAVGFLSPGTGLAVLTMVLVMWFAPKIATVIDILSRAGGAQGVWRRRRAFSST